MFALSNGSGYWIIRRQTLLLERILIRFYYVAKSIPNSKRPEKGRDFVLSPELTHFTNLLRDKQCPNVLILSGRIYIRRDILVPEPPATTIIYSNTLSDGRKKHLSYAVFVIIVNELTLI
jgi:hypothetical protein